MSSLFPLLGTLTFLVVLFGDERFSATGDRVVDLFTAILLWPLYWFVWIFRTAWNWKMNP